MLPLHKKMAYGMGRFGSTILLALTDLTTFYIYGAFFEISWILAGLALSMSYIVIGTIHWLTGYYSDHINTGLGRRKPFVIFGAPGLAISTFMLFIPNWFLDTADTSAEFSVFSYYLFFICLTKFFYAFLLTAFQAWMPEITDENERPIVSSMQNTANWIASGIGIGLGFIFPLLVVPGPPPGMSEMGLTILLSFCMICVLFYLPSIIWVREKPDLVIPERSIASETKTILRNRDYVGWLFAISFLSFTFTAIIAQVIGFVQEVLLLTTIETLLPPALALVISIMVFLFIWVKGINRLGKGKTLGTSMVILSILLFVMPLIAALPTDLEWSYTIGPLTFTFLSIVAICYFVPLAACISVYYLMSYVVPADIAQVDEIKTGVSRAGIYEGFKGVPYNLSQAISALLLGVLMDYSLTMTGSNAFGLTWWGPIYAPFLLLVALVLRYVDEDPDFDALKGIESTKKEKKKRKKKTATIEVAVES